MASRIRRAAAMLTGEKWNGTLSKSNDEESCCAGAAGVDLFLTHDKDLQKMHVPGIHFIAGLDGNVF